MFTPPSKGAENFPTASRRDKVMSATQNRLQRLRLKMQENGVGPRAIGPGPHMSWLLGFHPHPDESSRILLIGREKDVSLMPPLNAAGTRQYKDMCLGDHRYQDSIRCCKG